MLDQLVESKSNARENTRRSGFLLTTFVVIASVLVSAWLYSLFAKDYGLGSGDLELSELVAPVPVPEAEPPPEPEVKPEPKQLQEKAADVPMRKENIVRLDESPPADPPKVSAAKPTQMERPKGSFQLGKDDIGKSQQQGPPQQTQGRGEGGEGLGGPGKSTSPKADTQAAAPPPPPPPPAPPKKEEPPKVPKTISGGVVNGKATNLVKPPYPAAARAVRAAGAVQVSVKIDERGNVVSASAISGHPLLRQVAEQAARSSKFAPTQLSGQPVSVTGVIVYNFTP